MNKIYQFSSGENAKGLNATKLDKEQVDSHTMRISHRSETKKNFYWVTRRGNKRILAWPGGSLEVEALDAVETNSSASGALKPLKLTMPGKVLAVNVKEGDLVSPGQGLVVVEAMKMENLLMASAAAKVTKIHIKVGDRLESGTTLITFGKPDA